MDPSTPPLERLRELLSKFGDGSNWLTPEKEAALRQRLEEEVREGRLQPEQIETALKWVRVLGGVSPELSSGITDGMLKPQSPAGPDLSNQPLQPATAGSGQILFWIVLVSVGAFLYYWLNH